MLFQSQLFQLKEIFNSENTIENILNLSGNHICYWEFNLKSKEYKEFSAYLSLDGLQFCDFSWPKAFVSDESWNVYQESMQNLFEKNKTLDLKLEFKGLKKWIRIITRFSKEKEGFEGIVKDITGEYVSETLLRNRTIELSTFDEGLDNFTIVARTDPRGKILYANKEFCRLSKYSYEELIGRDHRLLNSGYHSKDFFKEMWNSIQKGESWRGVIKNKAKDETFYWVDTIVIPIRDKDGILIEILSFRFDVTQLMNCKEENAILKKQLAELMMKKNMTPSV